MRHDRRASKGEAGSTRLLSTEELFEGFNELYESAESEEEAAEASVRPGPSEVVSDGTPSAEPAHLEITESGDAFNVRAELPSDFLELPEAAIAAAPGVQQPLTRGSRKTNKKANPVLRAIDLLADADRENITATLRGGKLEVKLPKGRIESLVAARSALLDSAASSRPRGA